MVVVSATRTSRTNAAAACKVCGGSSGVETLSPLLQVAIAGKLCAEGFQLLPRFDEQLLADQGIDLAQLFGSRLRGQHWLRLDAAGRAAIGTCRCVLASGRHGR